MSDLASEDGRWSVAGHRLAVIVAGECVLAVVAIGNAEWHRPRLLVIAAALAIGSAVLIGRARMPTAFKCGLIALCAATALGMAAAFDPFGLRAVDAGVTAAIDAQTQAAALTAPELPQPGLPRAGSRVTISTPSADPGFAADLSQAIDARLPSDAGAARIDVAIGHAAGPAATYDMTWAIVGGTAARWCGRIVAAGQTRPQALATFADTIVATLRASATGDGACGV